VSAHFVPLVHLAHLKARKVQMSASNVSTETIRMKKVKPLVIHAKMTAVLEFKLAFMDASWMKAELRLRILMKLTANVDAHRVNTVLVVPQFRSHVLTEVLLQIEELEAVYHVMRDILPMRTIRNV
jgi:hypothetical protein